MKTATVSSGKKRKKMKMGLPTVEKSCKEQKGREEGKREEKEEKM